MRFKFSLVVLLLSVCSTAAVRADVYDELERFAGNIQQFSSIYPQEKVYLHFDNTSYYTGETIWFKAFVVNAADNRRAVSKVLYVDLLSPGGVVLKQQKLKIIAGQCDGSFPLLDASTSQAREMRGVLPYPSGFYEIRAYTMNMLNFSEEAIFSRVFPVYAKPSKDGAYYDEKPSVKIQSSTIEEYRPKTEKAGGINIGFYPEGGKPIIGIPCNMAFQITGENGLGIEAECSLEDSDTIFSTLHDGMGLFRYTPDGSRRHLTVRTGNVTRSFVLPEASAEGYSMHLSRKDGNLCTDLFRSKGVASDTLGLVITCRDGLVYFNTVAISDDRTSLTIDETGIEGVCRMVLFDRKGRIAASRMFYSKSDVMAPELEFTADARQYGPFQPIMLDFTLKDGAGNPFRDRFCLSVRDSRTTGNLSGGDLRSDLLLSSDLKGFIRNPEWYFASNDIEHSEALDLLVMIHGWERYDWNAMTGQKKFNEIHRVENGLTVNGWILSPSGRKPLEGVKVMAAVVPPDKSGTEQFDCITDSSGYFGLDLSDFYDVARMTIHTTEKSKLIGTSSRILFERSMVPPLRSYHPAETTLRTLQNRNSGKNVTDTKSTDGTASGKEQEDNYPKVIYENLGYLLPDVEIQEQRKYIDYYTFKAFNVKQDIERELDRAEFSGDVTGYLLDKGYTLENGMDTLDPANLDSMLAGTDFEIAMNFAQNTFLNGNGASAFWYVHDSQKCLYHGIYAMPWKMDMQDISGLIIYDRPMYLSSVMSLTPLLSSSMTAQEGSAYLKITEDTGYYYLIDIQVKDFAELSTKKELKEIGKRITTVDGYSSAYQFYSPEYPDGPVLGETDYRRTLYWNPNVITDSEGKARVKFYNNSVTGQFSVSGAGITASGQPYTLESGF